MAEQTDERAQPLDRLREAVRLMRERSEAAMSGPWEVLDSIHGDPYVLQQGRGILTGGCIALASGPDYGKGNAEHIASWDPIVALTVADWLDRVIYLYAANPYDDRFPGSETARALTLAYAYLDLTTPPAPRNEEASR